MKRLLANKRIFFSFVASPIQSCVLFHFHLFDSLLLGIILMWCKVETHDILQLDFDPIKLHMKFKKKSRLPYYRSHNSQITPVIRWQFAIFIHYIFTRRKIQKSACRGVEEIEVDKYCDLSAIYSLISNDFFSSSDFLSSFHPGE